ncbi:hypothetical protein A6770_04875 [Nostoc minutum NIES-26]|uniref:Uncharacterized protein n=1 Tax=Nostoc minutum NIES-26 TaxID=1844469 RepID=A0A367QD39_9NOSO|nr:hypothetical protein A6770_04875 [Nostoc minutum NIES-26]
MQSGDKEDIVNLKNPQLQVFRDLKNGQYTTEVTLTTGTIAPLAFVDISVQVQHLIGLPKIYND